MKARVKATGEIIKVNKITSYGKDFEVLVYYKGNDGFSYKEEQLDFEDLTQGKVDVKEKSLPKDEPDYWEKLKHQYIGMILSATYSSSMFQNTSKEDLYKNAIFMARELVDKLKEAEK